jgi:UDP-N-acetylglucosamine diphosphorylase / glucose-1-phosphate thymidylyltransferase / UDP-N-acetylgalactosamine diphosphorylase / glucosamine-1-phosphate N-acetyltransferase / galactosamine-1-phosphate N-acetyltransferase
MVDPVPVYNFPELVAFRLLGESFSPYSIKIAGRAVYEYIHEALCTNDTDKPALCISDQLLGPKTHVRQKIDKLFDVRPKTLGKEYNFSSNSKIRIGPDGSELPYAEPWHLLDVLGLVLQEIEPWISPKAEIEEGCQIEGNVRIEAGARIMAGTRLKGNIYIGENAFLGNDVLVRGTTSLAAGCAVGYAAEIKSSLVMESASIGPASAVIDSILGPGCIFGGSVRTMNTNPNGDPISFKASDAVIKTNRQHLGAVIGEGAILASGVLVSPGRNVAPNSFVGPGVVIMKNIPSGTRVVLRQDLDVSPVN